MLVLIAVAALAMRSAFSYQIVMRADRVNFQDNDAWYHMRLIDRLIANWPSGSALDPFALPGGQHIPVAPLFDHLTAGAALLIGLGEPSRSTVETVAAWSPAVLGALIPLAVFAAGRRLFDQRAALIAAALVAIMPGHLLERSRLGYVDHHALESLLSVVCLWLLARALQQPSTRERLVAAAWSGVALAAYLLSWASGAYLVVIIGAWLIVQSTIDSLRARPAPVAATVVMTTAAVAVPWVWLFQDRGYQFQFQMMTLVAAIAGSGFLSGIDALLARWRRSPQWLPVILIVGSAATWFAWTALDPSRTGALLAELNRLRPDASALTVVETMPLATFAAMPWAQVNPFMVLGTGLPLGAIGGALFLLVAWRQPRPEWWLLVVWTAITLGSTLMRNRFGYYLVPMLALLGGWLCAWLLSFVRSQGLKRDVIAAAIGALAFAPNLWPARTQMRVDAGLSPAWVAALEWLRQSTPAPFDDAQFYYRKYDATTQATLPKYTVMAWWDYGYWITRGAERVPIANPTQAGAAFAGDFLMERDSVRAGKLLDNSKSRYIVLDGQLPFRIAAPPSYVMGKFETIVTWGARRHADYYEPMYVKDARGGLLPALVFYPAYYETMLNRLYQFGGNAVTPTSSSVMSFADRVGANGTRYREVTAMETFPTYEQASAYLASLGNGPHRLVGLQPDQSPVPLAALEGYRQAWGSDQAGPWAGRPSIVIFERLPTVTSATASP